MSDVTEQGQGTRTKEVAPWESYAAEMEGERMSAEMAAAVAEYAERSYEAGATSNQTKEELHRQQELSGEVAKEYSDGPAISIANDVMLAIVNGGPEAQPYNWKWNRFNVKPFSTISYQQDYFVPGLVNLGWLENADAININQTTFPKQKRPIEVRKDLDVSYDQTGYPGKICWLPNDQLQAGAWGEHPYGPTLLNQVGEQNVIGTSVTGLQNPGPSVIYTNPVGSIQSPANATTCISDPNGNLWVLTTYGVCGLTAPVWPTTVAYPTFALPTVAATTVVDGTCVWTAVNPKGQGFRLTPVPPQSGLVWLIQPIGQMRAPRFTSLKQFLEPLPDDFSDYFKQGFFAECFRRHPDPRVRGKYPMERQLWMEALGKAVRQSDREMDDIGFYPGESLMSSMWGSSRSGPNNPYGPY